MLDDLVYMYLRDREDAARALLHWFIHFEIASCQQPFMELINRILGGINEAAQRRAERLTETLRVALEVSIQ